MYKKYFHIVNLKKLYIHFSCFLSTVIFYVSIAIASEYKIEDKIPIEDGVYFRSNDDCFEFHRNNLDYIDFSIEKSGREIIFPEVSCIVASVIEIRPERYVVESDCIEAGEPWQMKIVIDDLDGGKIRIDGEEHYFCNPLNQVNAPLPVRKPQNLSPANTENIEEAIEKWAEANDNCRGGFGDDPRTQNACEERNAISDIISSFGYCFGKENQSISEYEWHKCRNGSIRSGK